MKIGCLTSSRADFGIYLPLLQEIIKDNQCELEIIAFGTHVSPFHGYTLNEIEKYNFPSVKTVSSLLLNDEKQSIATSYGLTVLKFADFWADNQYDVVLALGDRYEMSAAVQAGIPFGVKFAHIHGGETTLGAIDNIYRHQITLASILHFTATDVFSEKVKEITGSQEGVYTVGSLSLSELENFSFSEEKVFREKYNIQNPFALLTFHPETVSSEKNIDYAEEMYEALSVISQDIDLVITMPNADTQGSIYRKYLERLKKEQGEKIILIENFGKVNYFNAMRYCQILLGNTSSGIIEAASFKKYVVNVGDRQKGRVQSENIFNAAFEKPDIVEKTKAALKAGEYKGDNAYYRDNAAQNIINCIKDMFYAKL